MATATKFCENNVADNYNQIKELIEDAELRAINKHKYALSHRRGEDVCFEDAAQDWFANFAALWRERRHKRMLEKQREEINRYKWIASERACCDLGRSAVEEWIHKHAAIWRVDFEKNYDDEEDFFQE